MAVNGRNVGGPDEGRGPVMLVTRRRIDIEWGDCDPADIVYFPNYFS